MTNQDVISIINKYNETLAHRSELKTKLLKDTEEFVGLVSRHLSSKGVDKTTLKDGGDEIIIFHNGRWSMRGTLSRKTLENFQQNFIEAVEGQIQSLQLDVEVL